MSEQPAEDKPRISKNKRTWQIVRFLVGIALGFVALWAVSGQGGELAGASAELSHLDMGWLLLAIAVEVLSLVAFAGMERRLVGCGGVHSRMRRFIAISFAGGAIASSMPAGPVLASAFGYRQFRRLGASEALAAWVLLASLVLSALGLAALATAGVLVAEREGAAFDLVGVVLAVLLIAVAMTAVVYHKHAFVRLFRWMMRVSHRMTGFPRRPDDNVVWTFVDSMNQFGLGRSDLAAALSWSVANWALDCGCLVCAYLAVGAGVPWRGLLLAYGAGQLAANLPITPGGLGVVEGSLVIALVAYGGDQVSTVAAVLLYRIVSFWGYLPVGWLIWADLTWRNRRADRLATLTADKMAPLRAPLLVQDQPVELPG
ncbi:MAG: YbhN family protein [Acidimicrobiales bacterium]